MAVLVLAACACTREHEVGVAITLGELRPDVRVLELRVYRGACPSVDEVVGASATPEHAQVWRVAEAPAAVGRLDEGMWAFAAVARGTGCDPIGFGCQAIEVGQDEG